MRSISTKSLIIGVILLVSASLAFGSTKGRIMTNGKVTMYKDNQIIATYTNQGPINEDALIVCTGTCMVKMQGISLSGVDKTRFALKESPDAVNLYIEKGKIYFLVSDATHQFTFVTPDGYYVTSEGFIVPASTEATAKGFIQVTGESTKIAMETGSMIVKTKDGTKMIKPGQALVLAMANPPDEKNGRRDKEGAANCAFFAWDCKTPVQQIAMTGAGIGIVGGLAYLAFRDTGDDPAQGDTGITGGTDDTKKGTRKAPEPLPPASPNR